MQLKKIAIVFLVVIMMFSLAAIGIAAEEAGSELSLSVKAESDSALATAPLYVKSGDVIKYVVNVDSNPGALAQIEIRASFDNEALVLQKVTYGSIFDMNNAKDRKTTISAANADGFLQVWVLADKDYRSDKTGAFLTLEFKVNETFDGNIDTEKFTFSYAGYSIGDASLQKCDLATPEVHAHHYGNSSSAAGDCLHSGSTVYECSAEGCTDPKLSIPTGVYGDHTFVKVDRIEPTEEKAGIIEHQKCSVCYKLFDMNGKEITDVSIPKIEKPIVDIDTGNPVVTIIIIVVAVLVVGAGAAAAVVVLKKKKIL